MSLTYGFLLPQGLVQELAGITNPVEASARCPAWHRRLIGLALGSFDWCG